MPDDDYSVPTPAEVRAMYPSETISVSTSALTDEELRSVRLAFRVFARDAKSVTAKIRALFVALEHAAGEIQTDREFQAMAVLDDLYDGLETPEL